MKKTITFLAFSALLYNASGQDMVATQRYFGGALSYRIQNITKYGESDFLMVGRMNDPESNPSGANMFALRTNAELSNFEMLRVGTNNRELGYAGLAFSDGTFGMVGHTTSNGATSTRDDGVFIRFNGQGNILNQKTWGENNLSTEVEFFDAKTDDDGNMIVVGRTAYPGVTEKGLIKKMTTTGFEMWSSEIDYDGPSRLHRSLAADGGYYFIGYVRQDNGNYNTLLCKTDLNGNLLFSRVYDLSGVNTSSVAGGNNSAKKIVDTGDGLIIAHHFRNDGETTTHTAILKVDYTGSIVWTRRLQFGTENNFVNSIRKGHGDNEYIFVGDTDSATPTRDAQIYSLSDLPGGPVLNWMRVLTGAEFQRLWDVESFDYQGSKGYIAVGDIQNSSGEKDAWIVRTDQFGGGWANEDCWLDNLPAALIALPVTVVDEGISLTPWNIVSDHNFTFDQPIVVPLNNDGICQPLSFVASVEGLEEFGSDIVVFPNPSSGEVYLRSDKHEGQPMMVEVFSVSGKTVLSQRDHSLNTQMPLRMNHCPPGMYFIRITSPQAGQSQHKLILR